MNKQNCEICGVELTDANRSKSYRNRCKSCVAKRTAAKRAESKGTPKTKAQQRTEQILQSVEKTKEIEDDVVRFIRHEAMRAGVTQDRVRETIRGMQL